MASKFIGENFLLRTKTAQELFHAYAKEMPIFDYHCHLPVEQIARDKHFDSITDLWLGGDHYKWRAMRSRGVSERFITGGATDEEKFVRWAQTLPYIAGNPLYHWSHLELARYFDFNEVLSEKNAAEVFAHCNQALNKRGSARGLIARSNVRTMCTTDDPTDTLEHHAALSNDGSFQTRVLPAFRPDPAFSPMSQGFLAWLEKLSDVTGIAVKDFDGLLEALRQRVEFFHQRGCRLSDHALDTVDYAAPDKRKAAAAFKAALAGKPLSPGDEASYKAYLIRFLGGQYAKHGWTMQLHIAALRDVNAKMVAQIGTATGFDSIDDRPFAKNLGRLLSDLNDKDELPKTILYTLNPAANYVLGSMIGCFQNDEAVGKLQFGSAWWFCDQKDGMAEQLKTLSNLGALSSFVGMLTDSRSFISYPRHEYFRRVLCSLIGAWVEDGEYPDDIPFLGKVVQDICYHNAVNYFNM